MKKFTAILLAVILVFSVSVVAFAADVYTSLGKEAPADPLQSQALLSEYTGTEIPYPLVGLGEREVRFDKTVEAKDILQEVLRFANTQKME